MTRIRGGGSGSITARAGSATTSGPIIGAARNRCAAEFGADAGEDAGPPVIGSIIRPVSGRTRVNCFTPGTLISTPRGERPIEVLKTGDMVITRDNGPQEIRWIGEKRLAGPMLQLDPQLQPVLIRQGALGPNLPERDLRVSPGHRVLLLGDLRVLNAAEAEVFISARHLVGTRGVLRDAVPEVRYIHFLFDRHEVVLSNGAWTESFRPCGAALEGVAEPAREELLELFPELLEKPGGQGFEPARRTLEIPALKSLRA